MTVVLRPLTLACRNGPHPVFTDQAKVAACTKRQAPWGVRRVAWTVSCTYLFFDNLPKKASIFFNERFIINHGCSTQGRTLLKTVIHIFSCVQRSNDRRRRGVEGLRICRRYDRELVLKPAISLKKSWGGYRRTNHFEEPNVRRTDGLGKGGGSHSLLTLFHLTVGHAPPAETQRNNINSWHRHLQWLELSHGRGFTFWAKR